MSYIRRYPCSHVRIQGVPLYAVEKVGCFFDSSHLGTYMASIFFWRDLPYWPILSGIIGGFIYYNYLWWKSGFSMEVEFIVPSVGSSISLFAYFLAYILLWRKKKQEENTAKKFEINQIY